MSYIFWKIEITIDNPTLGKRIISQIDLEAMVTEKDLNMRDSLVLTLLSKHTQRCDPEHKTLTEIRFKLILVFTS